VKLSVLLAVIVATVACGKKGPPLAPFVRVPAAVSGVTAQRIGSDVYLSFPVPTANADGQEPADIAALEVFAVTATRPPATADHRDLATRIATLPVRPIVPDAPVPANGSPPLPLPPGVDRGGPAVVRETLTPETRVPVELPDEGARAVPEPAVDEDAPPFGPLVAPAPAQLPRRHYFVVGVSPRGRRSDPSAPLSVPLETGSSAPGAPKVEYTATQMTLTWAPSPDARASVFLAPPPVKPPDNQSPANVTPAAPPLAPLPARSLGFTTEATTYHVFEVPPAVPAEDPAAIVVPKPLTPQPLAVTEHVITGVTFGVERCFTIRPVDQIGGMPVLGPASPPTCLTPQDTFPPAAPRSLAVIAGAGVINVIWDANTEADLAGYHVLRAPAPGDTLQAITTEPVAATTFRDESVQPGTRYVYAVVAVDRAGNRSAESNRVEETAR
jgi:hypothetical protein